MQDYQPATDLLRNRTILVTGAAHGIGAMAARAYARHGATVVLLDRDSKALNKIYDDIEAAGSPQPALYPMDLSGARPQDYDELADTLEQEFGTLEGLLHNAAQLRLVSRIDDYDLETWYQVLQVNLNAPFMLTQACLPLLRAAEDAALLFSSDKLVREPRAYWGAYAVSKAGSDQLMRTLADELDKTAIRVNAIDPGPTRTNMRAQAYPGEHPSANKPPEALESLYLWAMGPDSRGCHGQVLIADEMIDDSAQGSGQ